MRTIIPIVIGTSLLTGAAIAQTTTSPPPANTPPTKAPSTEAPGSPTMSSPSSSMSAPSMTDTQAAGWVDKVVYSSDGKNVGEVAQIVRDSSGKVTEVHADVGGFLGLGETRVRLTPAQFKLGSDRIDLMVSSEQVKTLPKIAK